MLSAVSAARSAYAAEASGAKAGEFLFLVGISLQALADLSGLVEKAVSPFRS